MHQVLCEMRGMKKLPWLKVMNYGLQFFCCQKSER